MRRAAGIRPLGGAGVVLAIASSGVMPGCSGDFDTTRSTPPRGTLGRELYSLVCDRVGAQALREDVTGSSYHAICHPDPATGAYGSTVDRSLLVPLDPNARDKDGIPVSLAVQQANRDHDVARIEALGRKREDLVGALDAAIPDEPMHLTCDPPADGSAVSMRKPLAQALSRMTDLYDDGTVPLLTESFAHVLDGVTANHDVQSAFARLDARQGYRPSDVAIGVARPLLAYPHLVDLANSLLSLIASDSDPYATGFDPTQPPNLARAPKPGKARDQFQQVLRVLHQEMRTTVADPPVGSLGVAHDTNDPTRFVYTRPLGSLELARSIFFAPFTTNPLDASAQPMVRRDWRGVAVVLPRNGAIPAPFVDGDSDGLADIDDLGRFVTVDGSRVPSPFFSLDGFDGPRNVYGLATSGGADMYDALDTRQTILAKVAKDLVPLFDSGAKREAVMSLAGGLPVVFGDHDVNPGSSKTYPPDPKLVDQWKLAHAAPPPAGLGQQPVVLKYAGYHADTSPLVDLLYAVGNVLADPTTDDTLNLFRQLAHDHPKELARLVGVGLQIKAIADKHPEAHIPGPSTLWDELLDVFAEVAKVWDPAKGGVLEDLIVAFGTPQTLAVKEAFTAYIDYKDELTYQNKVRLDPSGKYDLNGPTFDLTSNAVAPMSVPVDRSQPDTGGNRSALQKFMQLLHDANGLGACTKQGAIAHLNLPIVGAVDYPTGAAAKLACATLGGGNLPPDPMPVCGILRIPDVDLLLLDVALGRAQFDIPDPCLKSLLANSAITSLVGGADKFLEDQSGIDGFSLHPTVAGVSRLVYYDTPHDSDPGDDSFPKTLNFLKDVIDPVPSMACDPDPNAPAGVPLRKCKSFDLTLRGRDLDSLFPIETMDFIKNVAPLAAAFDDHQRPDLFVKLFDTLHMHWGSPNQSKAECDPTLPRTDARWCTQDGTVTYEPLLSEALKTDLFATLNAFIPILQATKVEHCTAEDPSTHQCTAQVEYDGVHVLAESVRALLDPDRAAKVGLVNRHGSATYVRNDGTTSPQVTPIELLIDALKGIDAAWDKQIAANHGDTTAHDAWRSARSQLVDQFFSVNGTGAASDWANPLIPALVPTLIDTLRGHVAAHCPTARFDGTCAWARHDLAQKLGDVVDGPTFAATLDLLDTIRRDDGARLQLEELVQYLIGATDPTAQQATITALHDVLQLFDDDTNLTPVLQAAADGVDATLVNDDGVVVRRASADALVELLTRVLAVARDSRGNETCPKEIDPEHTLAKVIAKLVTPTGPNKPAPIEVMIDVVADVNRAHPELDFTTKLAAVDYAKICSEVSDFFENKESGLEQVYAIIRQATLTP